MTRRHRFLRWVWLAALGLASAGRLALADQGAPVYQAVPTLPGAGGACFGPRVQIEYLTGKVWCCVASVWTSCGDVAHAVAADSATSATTAGALAADGTNCAAGDAALGVDAAGNAQGCWTPAVPTGTGWRHVTAGVEDAAASTPTYSQVGAEQAGAVATHAALTTGVHGVGASTVESVSGSTAKVTAHAAAADPHTGYALLAGRAGGQTLIGGTAASQNLTLQSTSNATRGLIISNDPFQVAAQGVDGATIIRAYGNVANQGTDTVTGIIRQHWDTNANYSMYWRGWRKGGGTDLHLRLGMALGSGDVDMLYLSYLDNGRLGVGVGPTARLHLASLQADASTNVRVEGYFANGAADTTTGYIRQQFDTNTAYSTYWSSWRKAAAAELQMRFGIASGAGDVDILTLSNSGKVNIPSLTASQLVATDGSKNLVSVAYASGTYTPTATAMTNLSSATGQKAHYIRVGSIVTVNGYVTATPSGVGACVLSLTLPVASNLAVTADLFGPCTAYTGAFAQPCAVDAKTDTDEARISFQAAISAGSGIAYSYSYEVL